MLDFLDNPSTDVYEADYLVLDFETTNKDKGSALNPDNRVVLTSWSTDNNVQHRFGNEYQIQDLVQLAETRVLVAHNAKFELQWLRRAGMDLTRAMVWDTLLAEYVFAGNSNIPLDLGSVASRYGLPTKEQYVDRCIKNGVCPSEIPKSFLARRCDYDVAVTERIFHAQYRRALQEDKLGVILTRCLLTPVLADIEFNGMTPDPDRVLPVFYDVQEEHLRVKDSLSSMYPEVNWNSPKQVAELLYDTLGFKEVTDRKGNPIRTAKGARKADADIITALKAKTKAQKQLQELVLLEAKLNTKLKFLKKLKDCCDETGVLYAQFNQSITKTHRLSSNGTTYKIQFQNMAREYKKLFKARHPGWLVGEQDGAQLEFRVAAYLGQDEQAVHDLRAGTDVHTFTAETITAAGQATDRQEAKAHTFKPLYGGSSGTKAEQAYYVAFKQKYKGIADAQQRWIEEVLRSKKLRIPSGLEFFWPDTKMQQSGYVTNTSSICNYPVQSLATADIIPIAVVYMWHRMKQNNLKSFIVNTIHDSVIMEVHPDEVQLITELGVDSFTHSVYNYLSKIYGIDFNVPLGIGSKFGQHWSEGEETKINVEPMRVSV